MLGHILNTLKPYSSMGIVTLYFLLWIYNYFASYTCIVQLQQYLLAYLAVIYFCLKLYTSGKSKANVQKQIDSMYQNLISNKGITTDENSILKEFYSYDTDGSFQITLSFCKDCNHLKLPRTHHCSQCNKCIAMMDHHCYFIGTCIGIGNYNIFLQFLTISAVATIFQQFIIITTILACKSWILIIASIILIPIALFTVYQLYGLIKVCLDRLSKNQTYIEKSRICDFEDRLKYNNVQYNPIRLYDTNSLLQNLREWLGPYYAWILPLPAKGNVGICALNQKQMQYAFKKSEEMFQNHISEYKKQGFSDRTISSLIEKRNAALNEIKLQ